MITETAIRMDDEFSSLIPPLRSEELAQLEVNLIADGCREPLVVWSEEDILLDGHNRYRICQQHEIPFDVRQVSLLDRDEAKRWIILNQFARRNLTPYQRAELALKLKAIIKATAAKIVRRNRTDAIVDGSDKEEWKQIPGFERYVVSTRGRVAKDRKTTVGKDNVQYEYQAGLVSQSMSANGYLGVTLRHGDSRNSFLVHRLVAEAFVPNPGKKPQVHHINGNSIDNHYRNLEWATSAENVRSQKAEYKRAEMEALRQTLAVGNDTIAKAEFLDQHADEQMKQKLRSGELSINAAYRDIRKVEQQEAKAQAKAAVPESLPAATERYTIHQGKLSDVGFKIADSSVDWIITDPPYGREYLGTYAELSDFAFRVLKPGGSLICMTGQSFLPEVMEQLGKHMTYNWTLAYLTPGGQSAQLWGRKVNTFWKPLLWFVKGQYDGDWIGDVCRSDLNDKQHHHWGQSENGMADIIERFSYPGQTICDPFCGGGTTGVVAVQMNRLFVGIDCDQEAVATTLKRLAEAASA